MVNRAAVVAIALVAVFAASHVDAAATCANYCKLVFQACQGASTASNAPPYFSEAGCLKVCAMFPQGTDGDWATNANSLECRYYHAGVANISTSNAMTHCVHAGSSGGGQCGSTCDAYCNIMTSTAAAVSLTRAPYVDTTACNAYCSRFFGSSSAQTNPAIMSGNNAQCREYHARAAVELDGPSASTEGNHYYHALPASILGQCSNAAVGNPFSSAVENYCDLILASCGNSTYSPSLGQYASRADCLKQASFLPRGWVSDGYSGNTSNSLDCRIYHAGVARDISSHCAHSGMNGKDQCGTTPCASYCQNIMNGCRGANAQYSSYAACYTQCTSFPSDGSETPYATSGNTLQCRMYHLGVAMSSTVPADIAAHCTHAGPVSAQGVCGSVINGYCNLMMQSCSTTYESNTRAVCEKWASTYPTTGVAGDTSGNTLFCRAYHAGVATTSSAAATTHCPHAGTAGGDATTQYCGSKCEAYCNTVIGACGLNTSNTNTQYTSLAQCVSLCAAFPVGTSADTTGDTLGCRSYHAGVAFRGTDSDKALHCPHAGPSGGATCGTVLDATCDMAVTACGTTGDNAQYSSLAQCKTDLASVSTGTFGATSGDSLQCRLYHAGVALVGDAAAKTLHCPHAGKTGGGVCGSSTAGASTTASATMAFVATATAVAAALL